MAGNKYFQSEMGLHISDTTDGLLSEICIHASDMTVSVDLKPSILARMKAGGVRCVWTPGDFLDLANRDAVDKALQRLVAGGQIRRIDRGLYDIPSFNRLTRQDSPPDPRAVIDAVARRDQIRVLVDGLTASVETHGDLQARLSDLLHQGSQATVIRLDLLDGLPALPSWMQDLLRPLLAPGANTE